MPRGRLVEAGDAVEHGGLAGAVRADQRGDLASLGAERQIVDGHNAAETHGQTIDVKNVIAAHPWPSLTRSDEIACCVPQEHGRRAVADQPARPPDHQQHHREAEYQHAVLLEAAKQFEAADHGQCGERDAELRAHAAEHDDREHQRRFLEGEGFRADEALPGGEERAGEAAEQRAGGERGELRRGDVDAERAAGDFVLAQRLPARPIGRRRKRIVTQLVSNASARIR